MNLDLTPEALEFGRFARQAFESAGGDELVQRAELDPGARDGEIEPVLTELGAWDLDPRGSVDELEAAAALCRAAGWWAVAYPVAERLCRPTDVDAAGTFVVSGPSPAAPVYGLDRQWLCLGLDGGRSLAAAGTDVDSPRKAALTAPLTLGAIDGTASPAEVALALVLPCWTLLGMLDRAVDLTRTYVTERKQFGQPLSKFQSVQFQLTDAEVERLGVEELAKYALWSIEADRPEVLADALALRLAAVEAAETVFRITHQLHGAIGFCDETTLSWVSRYSQPLRQLPLGLAATRRALTDEIGRQGLVGLFDATTAAR